MSPNLRGTVQRVFCAKHQRYEVQIANLWQLTVLNPLPKKKNPMRQSHSDSVCSRLSESLLLSFQLCILFLLGFIKQPQMLESPASSSTLEKKSTTSVFKRGHQIPSISKPPLQINETINEPTNQPKKKPPGLGCSFHKKDASPNWAPPTRQ